MTRSLMAAVTAVAILTVHTSQLRAQHDEADESRRLRDAIAVFGEVMSAEDSAIPRAILNKVEGIAIFPSTLNGGFIVGGMRGRGVLSTREQGGWSSPAFLTLTGGSLGLQIGGQAVDLVLVITNRRGLENLVKNQFKIGADAAASAGPVGRNAQASTDLLLRAQILSYSRARGLFAGVTVNGSTIRQDTDANERFYGKPLTNAQIVFEGLAGSPDPVTLWRETLDRYTR